MTGLIGKGSSDTPLLLVGAVGVSFPCDSSRDSNQEAIAGGSRAMRKLSHRPYSNRVGTASGAGCKHSLEPTAREQQSETARLIEDQYSKSD